MTTLSVVIPSWDIIRVLTRARELTELASGQVRYILVVPNTEAAKDAGGLDLQLLDWVRAKGKRVVGWISTPEYLSPVEAMALGARKASESSEVLAFLHDDVLIEQRGWDQAILDHFANHPRCGLVGFGGGIGFADIDIYKVPYDYRQLARVDFVSNMREAESHGRRVSEPMRVAALDGFSMITTREFYECGGGAHHPERGLWDECMRDMIFFHMNDAWISCMAAEMGYETWMLPVACHHQGGQTSVGRQTEYEQVVQRLGYASQQDLYDQAHHRVYERFARVLPIRVGSTQ